MQHRPKRCDCVVWALSIFSFLFLLFYQLTHLSSHFFRLFTTTHNGKQRNRVIWAQGMFFILFISFYKLTTVFLFCFLGSTLLITRDPHANAATSPCHATPPQPHEQLLMGWLMGGTMTGTEMAGLAGETMGQGGEMMGQGGGMMGNGDDRRG